MDNLEIFSFLAACERDGKAAVLVTLVASIGPSMRQVGGHMAVREDGAYVGALSAGCIETAIVAEALEALEAKQARTVRFGQGSNYIDIRLPCGGGIDLHFQSVMDIGLADRVIAAIDNRRPFALTLSKSDGAAGYQESATETGIGEDDAQYFVTHLPNPKLIIVGEGTNVWAMAEMAAPARVEVEILSPDAKMIERAEAAGINASLLHTLRDTDRLASDPWSAILFLFHDHEWERHLLPKALSEEHFYVGAMGSRAVHQRRTDMLRQARLSDAQIAAVHAPIGLIPSARDPHTLAVSALAEIIDAYHQSTKAGAKSAASHLQLAG
ncbi:XdhC family protein [Parasphingopyxis sp. CP4]|uniref:XdhC family protein n=1 Tax=Parasphingopyxis sp. CP4 TaxID=2724527 RepID=UPI0015A3511E|nr:XdhC family protein [Parasphingopyxis sp. CP4]QLC22289.1 XdhC family protein [Parasphingopyxis sp. CP4]